MLANKYKTVMLPQYSQMTMHVHSTPQPLLRNTHRILHRDL